MNATRTLAVALALSLSLPPLAFALDSGRIRDIERADTASELAREAERLAQDLSKREGTDAEERTQIAAEAAAYLLYVQTKQQNLILEKLDALLQKEP